MLELQENYITLILLNLSTSPIHNPLKTY